MNLSAAAAIKLNHNVRFLPLLVTCIIELAHLEEISHAELIVTVINHSWRIRAPTLPQKRGRISARKGRMGFMMSSYLSLIKGRRTGLRIVHMR